MSKQIEIARIKSLPTVRITKDGGISHKSLRRAEISHKTLERYHDALNPRLSIGYRIRQFLRAENEAGRIAKVIKDAALIFVPYGKKIDTLTGFVTQRLIKHERGSNMNWILSRLKEKSTWRGIVAVLTAVGVGLSPDQATAIVTLGVAAVGAFEVFFKDPQSNDAK